MFKVFNTLLFAFCLLNIFAVSCSTDLTDEKERQSVIDETNLLISEGDCKAARESISPLFAKYPNNDEVRITRASAEVCFSGFELLNLVANLVDSDSVYSSIARSLLVEIGDGKLAYLYAGLDIATNDVDVDPAQRSKLLNDFIMFLQLAIVAGILNAYGEADSEGAQVRDLDYLPSVEGTLSNEDACALLLTHSSIVKIVPFSSFSEDGDIGRNQSRMLTSCQLSGNAGCDFTNLVDRTSCDGSNQLSVDADTFIGFLNELW